MEIVVENLFTKFRNKGLLQIEIPRLIKDTFNIIDQAENEGLSVVNQGLAELGWGVRIIDHGTYEMIKFLFENHALCDLDKLLYEWSGYRPK